METLLTGTLDCFHIFFIQLYLHSSIRASASFYFALVNLTKACKIPLVKYQMV